ncbi:MAG: hypothetical protein OXU51_15885 [Candidatus Poribacteria bacterium]|nr:hypothetical protein [Candidatus Poribacteria bacterium]
MYKTNAEFWAHYRNLPPEVQRLAVEKFELLKRDPRHPSLNFKKVGAYWVARIGINYRTLAREEDGVLVWFWIGRHDEYMRRIRFGS